MMRQPIPFLNYAESRPELMLAQLTAESRQKRGNALLASLRRDAAEYDAAVRRFRQFKPDEKIPKLDIDGADRLSLSDLEARCQHTRTLLEELEDQVDRLEAEEAARREAAKSPVDHLQAKIAKLENQVRMLQFNQNTRQRQSPSSGPQVGNGAPPMLGANVIGSTSFARVPPAGTTRLVGHRTPTDGPAAMFALPAVGRGTTPTDGPAVMCAPAGTGLLASR